MKQDRTRECIQAQWEESIRVKQKDAALILITFSAMNYASPNLETYECSLVKRGFRNHIVTDESHITYTGLLPGSYRFTVNFTEVADETTEAGLDIVVLAPWYRSTLAWILYLLLLLLFPDCRIRLLLLSLDHYLLSLLFHSPRRSFILYIPASFPARNLAASMAPSANSALS